MYSTVITPEFWEYGMSLAHVGLISFLMSKMDKDGIALLYPSQEELNQIRLTKERFMKGVKQLEEMGYLATYSYGDNGYAWSPIVPKTQPVLGKMKRERDDTLPAPPPNKVLYIVGKLYGITEIKEAKKISPRTWGIKRSSGSISTPEVREVFEEWQKRQSRPAGCVFNTPVQALIKAPLEAGFTVIQLRALIEFAYEADHPAARFWRGENDQKRKYLGITNLFRAGMLNDRMSLINDYVDSGNHAAHLQTGALVAYHNERGGPDGTQTSPSLSTRELSRLSTQCGKILNLLIQRGDEGVWTQELAKIALKYSARVSELRGLGYSIVVAERTDHGNNRYVLRGQRTVDANSAQLHLIEGGK